MIEKNLQSLKLHYPDLYEILMNNDSKTISKLEKKNDFYNISFNGKYIHSIYDPIKEASRWVESLNIEGEDTISIIGLGLGYYLEYLIGKYPRKKFIIIEPNLEVFMNFLAVRDATAYLENKNIVFLVYKDANTIRTLFDYYIQNNKVKSIFYSELPVYKKVYAGYTREIYGELKKILLLLQSNLTTEICFSRRWLYNTISNLKYMSMHNNINCLKDSMNSIPVVIVSAGPSLDKNMHLLKEIYDKALIIAVGTGASILDSNGIEPHIIMGIEGNALESEIIKSLKNHNPLFVYAHMIHYKSVEVYPGEKMWISLTGERKLEYFFEKLGYQYPSIISGGSIAHTALSFAHWLKCAPIILIGQDLAYTDGKIYASGSVHQHDNASKEHYIEEKDIYGNRVYTKKTLLSFKHWFEDYVKVKLGNTKIFNCTEGGLNIEGIPNMPFREVISTYCKETYSIKDKIVEALNMKEVVPNTLHETKLKQYTKELGTCIKLSEQRLEKTINILNKELYKSEEFIDRINEVLKITNEIEEIEIYNIFIENTGKMYIDAITRSTNQQIDAESNMFVKREIITRGLLRQYSFADDNLKVAIGAIEEIEVEGLFD